MNKPFTVGEAAQLLCCAPRSVAKWCDAGLLKFYRLPSAGKVAGHRRIPYFALVEFCANRGIPAFPEKSENQQPLAEAAQ